MKKVTESEKRVLLAIWIPTMFVGIYVGSEQVFNFFLLGEIRGGTARSPLISKSDSFTGIVSLFGVICLLILIIVSVFLVAKELAKYYEKNKK